MPSRPLLRVLAILSLLAGGKAWSAVAAHAAAPETIRRICWQPYPETEEQQIEREYGRAVAVFSGFVRSMSVERVNILVLRTWKGKLGAEVVMATGTRVNANGTHTSDLESFPFRPGETYLLFGQGKSTDSMTASVCEPNARLNTSAAKIAILDKLVKDGR